MHRHALTAPVALVAALVIAAGCPKSAPVATAVIDAGPWTDACDRMAIVAKGDALIAKGDARGALTEARSFLSTCGEHERLRWVTFEAHTKLGEHDAAIAEATVLIDAEPEDPTFWWWRGRAHEAKGDTQRANDDKAKAKALCPTCTFNAQFKSQAPARP